MKTLRFFCHLQGKDFQMSMNRGLSAQLFLCLLFLTAGQTPTSTLDGGVETTEAEGDWNHAHVTTQNVAQEVSRLSADQETDSTIVNLAYQTGLG